MPNFLYLFRGGRSAQMSDSPEAMQQHMQKWNDWIAELTKGGSFKGGEPLDPNGKVVAGKKKVVTDGPFAEAKDLVGGYLVVSAPDINSAVELSRGCPVFENDGTVEVRPILKM